MNKQKGFTFVELLIVITLTAILGLFVFQFIKMPLNAYDSTAKRAAMVDEAHTIIKKIKRDVQLSLPNSVRISTSGTKTYLEMMLVSSAGRYRTQQTSTGTGTVLDFTTAITSFDMLNGSYTFSGGEKIVIANLGIPGFDAFNSDNSAVFNGTTGVPTSTINIVSKQFPLEDPNNRFYIVTDVVTYVCDTGAKTITRYSGYTPTSTQPTDNTVAPLSTATQGLLAKYLNTCRFTYTQGQNSRNAIVSMFVGLSQGTESINLYGESYVPNS